MTLDFSTKVSLPGHVCRRQMDGESVLLNLGTEQYHGLDPIGSQMLDALVENSSVEAALESLIQKFDVEPDRLRRDLEEFVTEMIEHDLLEAAIASPNG